MKRAKEEDTMDRISELPQGILQRIMSFLSQKEAVLTSLLSKSWRNIWCTRPILDFSDFNGNKQEFLSLANTYLQRYCDQKLCVEEFCICISLDDLDRELFLFLKQWVQTLSNMGMRKFSVSICLEQSSRRTHLPRVAFDVAESLQYLDVEKFMSNQMCFERTVLSKHPKKLYLQNIYITDEDFQRIISSCNLFETVVLRSCKGLSNIKANNLCRLKKFSFCGGFKKPSAKEELCSIEIYPPSLESIDISCGNLRLHKGANFRNLDELFLFGVELLSWENFSLCKFPRLKGLSIIHCDGLKDTNLFIDAPNIESFEYLGDFTPSISFATTTSSRKWCSDVEVTYMHAYGSPSSCLLKLKERLLNSLSRSQITLRITKMNDEVVIQDLIHGINGCGKPVAVERLSLHCRLSSFLCLLNGVFSICRPRNIGYYGVRAADREHIERVWKILTQRESSGNQLDDQFRQSWLRDLEQVSFEIGELHGVEWRPITLSELPQETGKYIRFALKWRENYHL